MHLSTVLCALLLVGAYPVSSNTDIATKSVNKFATKLYNNIIADNSDGSVCISPLSIATTLSMLYAGAQGQEAERLAEVMEYGRNADDNVHQSYWMLGESVQSNDGTASHNMSLANKIYVQDGLDLQEDFLSTIQDDYNGAIQQVTFGTDETTQEINDWIANKTRNKITNMLTANDLTADTLLALVNAVYFKGTWYKQFDEQDTRPEQFASADNSRSSVDMMYQSSAFRYMNSRRLRSQVVELPYEGEEMSMVVVLPNDRRAMNRLEKRKLKLTKIIKRISASRKTNIELGLPKFNSTQKYFMQDTLVDMGVPQTYSGITSGSVALQNAIHRTFISVTEQGAEAAAATVITMGRTAAHAVPRMVMNKPFIYMIVHKPTNSVVFLGRYMGPNL